MSSDNDDSGWWDSLYRPAPASAQLPPVQAGQPVQGGQPVQQRRRPVPLGPPEPPGPQQWPPHGRHTRRRKLRYGLAAVAAVAVAAAGVVIVLHRFGSTQTTGYLPTGSSAAQDARQTARAFLSAWESGNLQRAANYTDHPAAAKVALTTYRKDLHLSKITGVVESATKASSRTSTPHETVTYTARAVVATSDAASAVSGTWRYRAKLVAYQEKKSQYWYVAWAPDVLAPNLTPATHLATAEVPPHVTSVTDAAGGDLTSYGDAGLNTIAGLLEKGAPPGHGSPGLAVEIQAKSGKAVAKSKAVVVAPKNVSGLATTIDPAAESAAKSAVAEHNNSSMVVIQPSTGKILAIANNAGFNDFALTAAVAPGSTMKTITSTALFNEGVLTPDTGVACPPAFTIQGITYHNDQGESEPASTPFITDFARSCNNAFSTQWDHLTNGRLAATARQYYGLNQMWDIGIGESARYFNAPASASGSELAQEAFGEGKLTASPLAMASIAATIESGKFQQPYLVTGSPRVTAKPLPSQTDTWLKEMMSAVVTSGTAASIGFGPGVYGKTGTADIKGQQQPNSWFIAFEPAKNVAVGCLVVSAGYGAQVAGPEVRDFLNRY